MPRPIVVAPASDLDRVGTVGGGPRLGNCARGIAIGDSFATTGTDTFRSVCDAGAVITQIRIDSGFWLDGFVLGCSALHSPLVISETRD